MDNATGYLCVIGTVNVKKHEKNVDDIRVSIILYRTVTEYVLTGPIMFLLFINVPRRGLNNNFLMKYGISLVLVIIIMGTAYMTTKSW